MIRLLRTDIGNEDFQILVAQLDDDLRQKDGEDHFFFAQFNKLDTIRHVIVAYMKNEAVGCGALRPYSSRVIEIKRMFVLPEYRGQGIASMILSGLENWAQEFGYLFCILETGQKQPEAIRLYQKAGYKRIPNYPPYEQVENSVCMEKTLVIDP